MAGYCVLNCILSTLFHENRSNTENNLAWILFSLQIIVSQFIRGFLAGVNQTWHATARNFNENYFKFHSQFGKTILLAKFERCINFMWSAMDFTFPFAHLSVTAGFLMIVRLLQESWAILSLRLPTRSLHSRRLKLTHFA